MKTYKIAITNDAPRIRVNVIVSGFIVGEQNSRLLMNKDGSLTSRDQTILDHTPMSRFGTPNNLLGATMWLASPASAFVTGAAMPIGGGFSVFSGI